MFPPTPPQLKLSQMSSIRNGEIPVVVIYLQPAGTPTEYALLGPEEAVEILAAIEWLRDHAKPANMTGPAEQPAPANPQQEGERNDVRE